VHCESWTPSGQATSNASDDVGPSVCGSHRRRTPSSCAGQNYAAAWLQRKTHASTPVVSVRQMGCRGGRVASSIPRACAPLLHQRPANLMPPEVGMVRGNAPYWHRLVRPVHLCCWPLPCARGATPDASMADTLRYATRWRLPRSGQPSIIGQCIKEKHNLSTAETLPESCNNCAREEASHQGLIRFCRTATHSWER
jgi:hypothetical protein